VAGVDQEHGQGFGSVGEQRFVQLLGGGIDAVPERRDAAAGCR
jgi:hypothetical protein